MANRSRSRLRWLALFAFLAALGFTGYHLVRSISNAYYWSRHRDEPIQPWMTVGYVAHSYHVPQHVLFMALGLPPAPPDRRSLRQIALAQGRTIENVDAILAQAIVHARPPYPPPAPPPKSPPPSQDVPGR